ncbi:egl-9 [Symbiodinium sp. KB8]|nr:egl-9 [Symbiodinium sp. KB8]
MARRIWASLAAVSVGCCLGDAVDADCKDGERPGLSMLQAKAQARESGKKDVYHWSSGRGNFPYYAVSNASAPFDLAHKHAWNWSHPDGRFATLTYGTAIDHKRNVYLSGADGVRKFDHNGKQLWEHICLPAQMMDAPSLYDGKVFGSDTKGNVVALDMEKGEVVWKTQVAEEIGQDNGFTMANDGVVVAACDWHEPGPHGAANHKVQALNASNGSPMWSFEPDSPVWNFLPLFVDNGDFIFQDLTGKAYRLDLRTGAVRWKNGGKDGTWTDGSAAVGNGMVFTVHNNELPGFDGLSEYNPGTLSAFNITDGTLIWKVVTPRPPNNAPAIGKVKNYPGNSVVMPICQQVMEFATCDVQVHDADTGILRWVFHGPMQMGPVQAGDLEGMAIRQAKLPERTMCLPNGWSAPTIDAQGTVFVGNEEGMLFSLRDMDGDGTIFGDEEVSGYDTKAAFSGSSSPAIAPGFLAAASCDSLFVFKVNTHDPAAGGRDDLAPKEGQVSAAIPALGPVLEHIDTLVGDILSPQFPERMQCLRTRSHAMFTCYPATDAKLADADGKLWLGPVADGSSGKGSRGYLRHLDNVRAQGHCGRILTTILYLNEDWGSALGGSIRLFEVQPPLDIRAEVLPKANRLLCFWSDEIPHEVLPPRRDRFACTFWYLDREEDPSSVAFAKAPAAKAQASSGSVFLD